MDSNKILSRNLNFIKKNSLCFIFNFFQYKYYPRDISNTSLLARRHHKGIESQISLMHAYHSNIYEFGHVISSLLWCGTTENHALDPLSQAIEHNNRSLQSWSVTQRSAICIFLEIMEL
jgi:hypothetical protein